MNSEWQKQIQLLAYAAYATQPPHTRVPNELQFGRSAKVTFEALSPKKTSDNSEFSSSTPISKAQYERTASFFTADELTPVASKPEKKSSFLEKSELLHSPQLKNDAQQPMKAITDSSYFNKMMETVNTSQIDCLLSEKSPVIHKPAPSNKRMKVTKPENKSKDSSINLGSFEGKQVKGLKIDLTLPAPPHYKSSKSSRILSPTSKPPILSPLTTRSGLKRK